MAKKTYNWPEIFRGYNKANAKEPIHLKIWCENNGITYSSARREFAKLKRLGDQAPESDPIVDHKPESASKPAPKPAPKEKPRKRNPNMARHGNQNARIHGLFTKRFGEAWDLAKYFDEETRYKVLQAQAIQTEMFAIEYREAIEDIELGIKDEERSPNDDEYDRIIKLQDKLDRCALATRMIIDQLDKLDSSVVNREYASTSTKKQIADIQLKRVATRKTKAEAIARERDNIDYDIDKGNKTLQGDLLKANIEKTKKQTELTTAQLKALDKGDGRDHDDIDDLLDEIMAERDPLMRDIPEEY